MENLTQEDLNEPDIEQVKENHPKTKFEIYCDENPGAIECRIYED